MVEDPIAVKSVPIVTRELTECVQVLLTRYLCNSLIEIICLHI